MGEATLNYISLFSSAGVGCYGFTLADFNCIATVEILEKRMQIQRYNQICSSEDGYIVGDLEEESTHNRLEQAVSTYFGNGKSHDIDVIMATPPCQGMSVANHKKGKELKRNSLVVESIKVVKKYLPKFFIFENVRSFSRTTCTDIDGVDKPIGDAIFGNLAKNYHIETQVLNLKNYGANSSRTRTLVIGVRRDQKDTCPLFFFPDYQEEKNLFQTIGHLSRLRSMGEFSDSDFFHSFRPYQKRMLPWIKKTPYGQSAFDNEKDIHRPHQIKNGQIVPNKRKNGGKYQRQVWDKVAPCVHTRNDCLASQNTIHPEDDRVFSIRELMLMMSIPKSFKWIDPAIDINSLKSYDQKHQLRSKTEKTIRECIGEAVPTAVILNIANKIKDYLNYNPLKKTDIESIIHRKKLTNITALQKFIEQTNNLSVSDLFKICEQVNLDRDKNAAFHTSVDIAYSSIEHLPPKEHFGSTITVLEPAVGAGVFVFVLAKKYPDKEIHADCIDIDANALHIVRSLADKFNLPNLRLNLINDDFITSRKLKRSYDIAAGNPPFMKVKSGKKLREYQSSVISTKSSNIFTYFIEKCLSLANHVVLIAPKALLGAPDYAVTRKLLQKRKIVHINDFNEKAFNVRIETISFYVTHSNNKKQNKEKVIIYSYLKKKMSFKSQSYITENIFDTWLLYRDTKFDSTYNSLSFGVFKVFRDRQLTKKNTKPQGQYQVIKARNIGNNEIIENEKINRYVDDITGLAVAKFLNKDAILIPNLTYNPRAARLPKGCIADGSAAILYSENGYTPTDKDIAYFGSSEFNHFYRIARNYGTRSLNIDSNSVNYFGIKKNTQMELFESPKKE